MSKTELAREIVRELPTRAGKTWVTSTRVTVYQLK